MTTNAPGLHDSDAAEDVSSEASKFEAWNALSLNSLNLQSLDLNELHLDTLAVNMMSQRSLNAIQDPGEDGYLARELVRYAAGCALNATQTFQFSWTEGQTVHNESYPGGLGLATSWSTAPLTLAQQRALSACLLARVNFYGETVAISLRGPQSGLSSPDSHELKDYSMLEGAFWGDLFGATAALYSCHYGPNIAASREQSRDCAAGHLNGSTVEDCGDIHIVGDCGTYCQPPSGGTYYPGCRHNLNSSYNTQPLTVWLEP